MNERMMRWAPQSAAEFITAFSDGKAEFGDPTWLVWAYEGDYTLADLMVVRWPGPAVLTCCLIPDGGALHPGLGLLPNLLSNTVCRAGVHGG